MKNKTTQFLKYSIISVSLFCVVVFALIGTYMNRMSTKTIQEVGTIYMSGMNEQVVKHFETIVTLRMSQIKSLMSAFPSGSYKEGELPREEMAYAAETREFEYLALCSRDGEFEMLLGSQVEVSRPQLFLAAMNKDENKVAVGRDANGKKVILLGISGVYPMSEGRECTGLVAGLSADYFREALLLDKKDAMVQMFIVRDDGEFVIREGHGLEENYYERIRDLYQGVDGKNAEQYITELKSAMAASENYSALFSMDGERRHLYGTKLPSSDWYLMMVLSYGPLNESVDALSFRWICLAAGGCALVLFVLLNVFAKYYRMTRRQIHELDEARKEAVLATQAKSEFLSNMSHDIRTPMNAIVGMTAIAVDNLDNKEQVRHCLKKITLSSRHLLGLINDVLDMSKIESGKLTLSMDLVSLREVIDSIVGIVQPQVRAKKQSFDVFIDDISTENVCCDSVRLNQVLLNFLSNAIKFTPEGGKIELSLYEEPSERGEEYIRVHILVKDTGIGMSKEFLDKIYESYAREDSKRVRKTEGAGLGMAITKYIVDAMGGTIQVESEQGKGTEFHVILDLEKAEVREEEMILPEWNMLVVDDDEQLCESAVASLKSIGVKAEWTLDGESAVKMALNRHQKGDSYQIILLDWKLPDMDGIETARRLREELGNDIPILLISAYDWSGIQEAATAAGINGFISKPLFKSTLFYELQKYADGIEENERPEEKNTELDLSGMRVLMAEDNDLNWEIANALLSQLGLTLDWAENGQICVDMFSKSEVGYYDAVLMDIRMPVMTGYEATKAIRGMDRPDAKLPIIAMTADAFAEDVRKCLNCGMDAHVAKPIDIHAVARLLEKLTGEKA